MSGTEGGSRAGPLSVDTGCRLLGKGGMGEVYEAEDTEKDRIVALKLLLLADAQGPNLEDLHNWWNEYG